MARFQFYFYILYALTILFTRPSLVFTTTDEVFYIIDSNLNTLFQQDWSPPPPLHSPLISCVDDLGGVGSLDTTCQIVADLNFTGDMYIQGKGNFYILPNVRFRCAIPGCYLTVNITGNFSLGNSSSIVTGGFELVAYNASFLNGSAVNTTGFAGDPPAQTSGTPQGTNGAGGGHGGRGASCLVDNFKFPEDVWGGDAYSWSSLQLPISYGSKGGSTSKEVDYGGYGGGRLKITILELLVVDGSLLADGGDGGSKGGGGSGGSIYIKAHKM